MSVSLKSLLLWLIALKIQLLMAQLPNFDVDNDEFWPAIVTDATFANDYDSTYAHDYDYDYGEGQDFDAFSYAKTSGQQFYNSKEQNFLKNNYVSGKNFLNDIPNDSKEEVYVFIDKGQPRYMPLNDNDRPKIIQGMNINGLHVHANAREQYQKTNWQNEQQQGFNKYESIIHHGDSHSNNKHDQHLNKRQNYLKKRGTHHQRPIPKRYGSFEDYDYDYNYDMQSANFNRNQNAFQRRMNFWKNNIKLYPKNVHHKRCHRRRPQLCHPGHNIYGDCLVGQSEAKAVTKNLATVEQKTVTEVKAVTKAEVSNCEPGANKAAKSQSNFILGSTHQVAPNENDEIVGSAQLPQNKINEVANNSVQNETEKQPDNVQDQLDAEENELIAHNYAKQQPADDEKKPTARSDLRYAFSKSKKFEKQRQLKNDEENQPHDVQAESDDYEGEPNTLSGPSDMVSEPQKIKQLNRTNAIEKVEQPNAALNQTGDDQENETISLPKKPKTPNRKIKNEIERQPNVEQIYKNDTIIDDPPREEVEIPRKAKQQKVKKQKQITGSINEAEKDKKLSQRRQKPRHQEELPLTDSPIIWVQPILTNQISKKRPTPVSVVNKKAAPLPQPKNNNGKVQAEPAAISTGADTAQDPMDNTSRTQLNNPSSTQNVMLIEVSTISEMPIEDAGVNLNAQAINTELKNAFVKGNDAVLEDMEPSDDPKIDENVTEDNDLNPSEDRLYTYVTKLDGSAPKLNNKTGNNYMEPIAFETFLKSAKSNKKLKSKKITKRLTTELKKSPKPLRLRTQYDSMTPVPTILTTNTPITDSPIIHLRLQNEQPNAKNKNNKNENFQLRPAERFRPLPNDKKMFLQPDSQDRQRNSNNNPDKDNSNNPDKNDAPLRIVEDMKQQSNAKPNSGEQDSKILGSERSFHGDFDVPSTCPHLNQLDIGEYDDEDYFDKHPRFNNNGRWEKTAWDEDDPRNANAPQDGNDPRYGNDPLYRSGLLNGIDPRYGIDPLYGKGPQNGNDPRYGNDPVYGSGSQNLNNPRYGSDPTYGNDAVLSSKFQYGNGPQYGNDPQNRNDPPYVNSPLLGSDPRYGIVQEGPSGISGLELNSAELENSQHKCNEPSDVSYDGDLHVRIDQIIGTVTPAPRPKPDEHYTK